MALQLGALRDALLEAGASPGLATAAAEELADYERQLAAVRTDLTVLKWMVATSIAVQIGGLWLMMNILSRLP